MQQNMLWKVKWHFVFKCTCRQAKKEILAFSYESDKEEKLIFLTLTET